MKKITVPLNALQEEIWPWTYSYFNLKNTSNYWVYFMALNIHTTLFPLPKNVFLHLPK